MKKTFEPTEGFISLYQKAEDARKKVLQYLATYTGFNESWCDKNPVKCLEYLNEKQQRKIDDLTLHAQIIKRYLWCKLYYENFDEVKDVLLDSSKIIQYNPKTKTIEVKEVNRATKKMKETLNSLKKQLKNFENKYSEKNK